MTPRRGDIVLVEFLDHVEDGDEPMRCFVAGRLRYKGKVQSLGGRPRRYMVIESWWLSDDADEGTQADNAKTFTSVCSTRRCAKRSVANLHPTSPTAFLPLLRNNRPNYRSRR